MKIHVLTCGIGLGFLIELPQGLYLIDSGSPGMHGAVLARLKALGRRDLKLIWITHAHYDHYGSAAVLRDRTGAKIGVHPADANFLAMGKSPLGTARNSGFLFYPGQAMLQWIAPLPRTTPDFTLEDGETFERFGWETTVVHTPGHTPGHTSLLLSDGIAFAGDLIAGVPKMRIQYQVATDWSQLPGSLEKLKAARPEWVYSGHCRRPMPGDIFQKIKPRWDYLD
jgi:glyoxylase-like metal-dependent hydrolase (beta-lactamase superfamily II)